jgi:hypothetical protein
MQGCWLDWRRWLLILEPRTVVRWHRLGFRLFWRCRSRVRAGRASLNRQMVSLIHSAAPVGGEFARWGARGPIDRLAASDSCLQAGLP